MGDTQTTLRSAIALADLCELTAAMFRLPSENLSGAIWSGALRQDLTACLRELQINPAVIEEATGTLGQIDLQEDSYHLFRSMRKEFTSLYQSPHLGISIQPYEAAFIHVLRGYEGVPVQFRSSCTLDVERQMKQAGVLPTDAQKEPVDSIWNEFSFVSFLYGSLAAALTESRLDDALSWENRIDLFWSSHASHWWMEFMTTTGEEAASRFPTSAYAAFSHIGGTICGIVESDVAQLDSTC